MNNPETTNKKDSCPFAGKWNNDVSGNLLLSCKSDTNSSQLGTVSGEFVDANGSYRTIGRYREYNDNYYLALTTSLPNMIGTLTAYFSSKDQTITGTYQWLTMANTVNLKRNTMVGDRTFTRIK